MKPPCVVVVQYLLPAIRAKVAEELIKKYGLKSKDVAEKLKLTQAAISQYLSSKRGEKGIEILERSENAIKIIDELTYKIVNEQVSFDEGVEIVCQLCQTLRREGVYP
jgi:hypothetical protein